MKCSFLVVVSFALLLAAHAQHVGINTNQPNRPLTIKGTGDNVELLSFVDRADSTRFHINLAANGLNFARSGVKEHSLFLDNLGNVGIGTSAPFSALHVNQPFINSIISMFQNQGGYASILTFNGTTYSSLGIDNVGGFVGTVYNNASFRVQTGAIDRIFVSGDKGHVGIGTSSPGFPLHVSQHESNSVVAFFRNLRDAASIVVHNGTTYASLGTDNAGGFVGGMYNNEPFRIITGGADRLYVSEGGYVGIGTINPLGRLHVRHQFSQVAVMESQAASGYLLVRTPTMAMELGADANGGYLGTLTNTDVRFQTSKDDRMIIKNANGHVGIGTMNPTSRLHVSSTGASLGNFETTAADATLSVKSNNHQVDVGANATGGFVGTLTASDLSLHTNYLNRLVIKHSTGRIGIGTADPQRQLHVAGDALFTDGIYLPTAGGTAASLNHYEEATISSNIFNGASVYHSNYNYRVVRTGRQVTITLPREVVNMSITPVNELVLNGLPARFRPANDAVRQTISVLVNGTPATGLLLIKTDGSMGIRANVANPNASWFSVVNGGFYACTLSYVL